MATYNQPPQDQSVVSQKAPAPAQYGGMPPQATSAGGYQPGPMQQPPQPNYHQLPRGPPGSQQGYMQQPPPGANANPHRLFGTRGYRPRLPPGPGYQ